jgi:dihydroorotate dehydrogenase electron transfer subunit
VHLRVPGLGEAVLRRPFSIFKAAAGRLELLYKTVGAGTRAMTRLSPGDEASVLGPLGRGFPRPSADTFPVLVGGGYGMAALYLAAERAGTRGLALAGGRTAGDILCESDFQGLGWDVRVATEDGSAGHKGLVTDLLDVWLARERAGRRPEIFACGPMGMLKAVSDRAAASDWRAWVSLDKPMGCGVGACLACVQRVRMPEAPGWKWARICTEGPVFDSRDILWSEEEAHTP